MKKIILASLLLMAGLTASAQGNFSAQANTLKLQYQKKAMTRADGAEDGTPATLYNLQGDRRSKDRRSGWHDQSRWAAEGCLCRTARQAGLDADS
jgi:hypothetical protein